MSILKLANSINFLLENLFHNSSQDFELVIFLIPKVHNSLYDPGNGNILFKFRKSIFKAAWAEEILEMIVRPEAIPGSAPGRMGSCLETSL